MPLSPPKESPACLSDFALDELVARLTVSEAEASHVAHLSTCSRCATRLREFQATKAPPLQFPVRKATRGRFKAAVIALAAATLPLAALGIFENSPKTPAELSSNGQNRTKGDVSFLVIVRGADGVVSRWSPGRSIYPGDTLRFEVASATSGFVGVVGVDEAGATTVYSPVSGKLHQLTAYTSELLPEAIITDETLGTERLIALVCQEPVTAKELESQTATAVLHAAGKPSNVKRIKDSCAEATVDLVKVARP